jgi:hypothetical protein
MKQNQPKSSKNYQIWHRTRKSNTLKKKSNKSTSTKSTNQRPKQSIKNKLTRWAGALMCLTRAEVHWFSLGSCLWCLRTYWASVALYASLPFIFFFYDDDEYGLYCFSLLFVWKRKIWCFLGDKLERGEERRGKNLGFGGAWS